MAKIVFYPASPPHKRVGAGGGGWSAANWLKTPVIVFAGRPGAALLLFCSLVVLGVARCYLWIFTLYINIKICKNSC